MFIWRHVNDTRQTDCRLVLCSHHMLLYMGGGVLVWKAADGLRNLSCHTSAACADKPSKPAIGPTRELLRHFFTRIPFGFTLSLQSASWALIWRVHIHRGCLPFHKPSTLIRFSEACTAADLISRNVAGRGEERSCYTS